MGKGQRGVQSSGGTGGGAEKLMPPQEGSPAQHVVVYGVSGWEPHTLQTGRLHLLHLIKISQDLIYGRSIAGASNHFIQ